MTLALAIADSSPPRAARRLLPIVGAAVALRLAAALYLGNDVSPLPGAWDQLSYDALAQRVAGGHGFTFAEDWWPATRAGEPTAHWSFLYTGLVAALYATVGHLPAVVRAVQAILVGILLPWGTFRLTRCLFGERPALWSAGLAAGYAYFIYYSATLMTEMPAAVALVWLMTGLLETDGRSGPGGWLRMGLLAGVLALFRQVALLPVPLAVAWRVATLRSWRAVRGAVAAAGVAALLILPVTLRNHRAFDRFVPLNTNAGFAFFWANHPIHGDSFQSILPAEGPRYQELIPPELLALAEADLDRALLARGWGFVKANPGRYLRLSASRVADYFQFWPSSHSGKLSNFSRVASFGLCLPFMLWGLWLSRHRWRSCLPLYLWTAAFTAIHLLSWALIRYRLPVDALLLPFAGLALARATARWAPRPQNE